ncbi:MAG: hypothetical protein LQ339_001660 [Xanthoria mediterranea]|nr:MAG: hypothetical protein LQ339_001660 [Xanthoria mediterranea]
MQTSTRGGLPPVRVIEDGRAPPPVQRVFPPRRHSSNIKTSNLSTPIDRSRQQTLTQIVPSFSHLSSSLDGADDLNVDALPAMAPKKKKRGSKPLRQKHTITQMDPFRQQRYSDDSHTHSDFEPPDPPSRRKKRKSTSSAPVAPTVQTRSAKRRATLPAVQKGLNVSPSDEEHQSSAARASPLPKSQDLTMPAPKTPTTARRKVIPSSQSPADTPISTRKRSRRNIEDITPLQERSVNTPSRSQATSRRKSVLWAPKLEVADSTDVENEDSQCLIPIIVQPHPTPIDRTSTPRSQIPQKQSRSKPPTDPPLADNTNIATSLPVSPRERKLRIMGKKDIIADSDHDAVDPASQSSRRAIDDESYRSPLDSRSSSRPPNVPAIKSLDSQNQGFVGKAPYPHDDEDNNDSFETVSTQVLLQPIRPAPPRDQDPGRSLITDEAATRPAREVSRFSSPTRLQRGPVLETESQFENAWRDYTPPLEDDGDSSKTTDRDAIAVDTPAHEPFLSLVDRCTNNDSSTDLQLLPPIPPSQATTTDTTQVSLRHAQIPHETPIRNTQLQRRLSPSQQRHALSSSSPFHTRKGQGADTYMGYQGWNGVPMTESQLLPDSLLNDSLGLPLLPGVEEELELEMEDY